MRPGSALKRSNLGPTHLLRNRPMHPLSDRDALRDHFVAALLTVTGPLQASPDPELTLEALIEAAGVFQERLRQELAELRIGQVE